MPVLRSIHTAASTIYTVQHNIYIPSSTRGTISRSAASSAALCLGGSAAATWETQDRPLAGAWSAAPSTRATGPATVWTVRGRRRHKIPARSGSSARWCGYRGDKQRSLFCVNIEGIIDEGEGGRMWEELRETKAPSRDASWFIFPSLQFNTLIMKGNGPFYPIH